MARRFFTPTILLTPAAMDVLVRAHTAPLPLAERHFAGEWGRGLDNAARNEEALRIGQGTVISVFDVGDEAVWVVSHIDPGKNSYTTIMLPSEY